MVNYLNELPHVDISVIIPSYNSARTVEACLQSVLNQKTKAHYEVLVVDSSTDNTPKILKRYVPKIRFLHFSKRCHVGTARNIGIKNVKADIIVFIDADCVVNDSWIDNIYYGHEKYDIVGGRLLNGNPESLFGWCQFFTEFTEFASKYDKVVNNIPGGHASYKEKIFREYGLFDETSYQSEDFIFNSKIREKKFFSSRMIAKHTNRTNFFANLQHAFRLGYGDAFARAHSNLPGKFLLKYKLLIPLICFYRFFAIGYRAIRADYFLIFFLTSPLVFISLLAYNMGFAKYAFK